MGSDAFHLNDAGNVTIENSYITDLGYNESSHADGVQVGVCALCRAWQSGDRRARMPRQVPVLACGGVEHGVVHLHAPSGADEARMPPAAVAARF